ncbi:MAG TPA: maltose acetyltransferase domain-containing protein [Micromonospora sp.]|nr:maltose acetyltransferase domain-containing protein [Micromonospora sp.]
MKKRMLAGEPYQADDPELVADLQRAALLLERWRACPRQPRAAR